MAIDAIGKRWPAWLGLVAGDGHSERRPIRGSVCLRSMSGRVLPLRVDRWFGSPTPEEEAVLERVIAPVLDIGCGPGRHTMALVRRGVAVVGVDCEPAVVKLATRRGANVVLRSVFEPLPGDGSWGSALLLDGNVGIGGDPAGLLRRVREVVRDDGRALVEVEPPGSPTRSMIVRLEAGGGSTEWFPWAQVGADRLLGIAHAAGFDVAELWGDGGRWFARLDVG